VAGGKPAPRSYIFGNIRHGRDVETRQGMLRDLSQMWTRVTGQSEVDLMVSRFEVDPNFDEPKLIVDVDGPVTTLTLNRPQTHNGSVDGRGFDYTGPDYRGWMAEADCNV
jgi:hypothetical protein